MRSMVMERGFTAERMSKMRSDTSKDVLNSLGIGVHPRFDSRIVHQDMADALSGFVRDKTLNIDEVRTWQVSVLVIFFNTYLQADVTSLIDSRQNTPFSMSVIGVILQRVKIVALRLRRHPLRCAGCFWHRNMPLSAALNAAAVSPAILLRYRG